MTTENTTGQYRFWGETTAFLALFLDNVGTLIFFSAILVFTFNYPADIILTRMIPGTAVGICIGDLVYTWLALRLRKKTGRTDVTAMPLGIDTPSTIGIAYAVMGPAYVATHDAQLTWHIGMATLFMIGTVKIITSFFGGWVQRIIPTAGLLGPLAGIGLLLLGFLPMIELFNEAIVGMVALGLIFTALMSKMQLPGKLPGVLAAVVLGTGIHFVLGYGGYLPEFTAPTLQMTFSMPAFSIDFIKTLPHSIQYLTIAIPFGILTIIGGINNTESARLAGDDYRTRDILLTEAFSSLIAAFFGGVAQTTPYIGHPAYKKMGATWWYTLLTGLLIGICSVIGLLSLFVSLIPRAVIAPIFIFIGFEIMRQAYNDSPPKHSPAVSLSILPVIASLVLIILGQFMGAMGTTPDKLPVRLQTMHQTLTMLSNGFIITGLLWGSMLAFLIDHQARLAALCAAVCAILTLFGIIHSIMPTGELYLPWMITSHTHYMTAAAYFALSGILLLLTGKQNESTL
ncbi:MAG: MFS transporter [Deltaproteobacteria bacterium HGW-Deltaproteobacteria-2]|jgi:AGZA family xanthine/uracil permease-like MFS transporter|nr:MAG: MFS transporter [Deltaproteobacteria bacterium HGW-Deltaproteobacteria-2]